MNEKMLYEVLKLIDKGSRREVGIPWEYLNDSIVIL